MSINWILLYINLHFIWFCWIWIFLYYVWILYQWSKDNMFLVSNDWFIILDWKFWNWKTRFMVNIQKDAKNYIIISNFFSWYTDIRFNSMDDLINLLTDIEKLSMYQNYSIEELNIVYKQESLHILNEKKSIRLNIKNKYKNIPSDWYYTKFLWTCDEFQNLFFSRNSLSNFSWWNKILLQLLHQVRHMNSLFIFATQNADELDIKFRRLATFYVNTWSKFKWWVFWYNVYFFKNNANWRKLEDDDLQKINKAPIIKINKYKLNNIIIKINLWFLWLKRKYWFEKLYKINYKFDELNFSSKFNCCPDNSIYKPWDIYIYLDKFYKKEKLKKDLTKYNYQI